MYNKSYIYLKFTNCNPTATTTKIHRVFALFKAKCNNSYNYLIAMIMS